MFFQNQKVKKSFKKVRQDMSVLKQSTTDWIIYLNAENKELKSRVDALENQLKRFRVSIYG